MAWALVLVAVQVTAQEQPSPFDHLRALQQVKQEMYQKIAPGIVSVELVHKSVPAWAVSTLERCADECRSQPWKCGNITEAELGLWQEWGDSFLRHAEQQIQTGGLPVSGTGEAVTWKSFLDQTLTEWEATIGSNETAANQSALQHFQEALSTHMGKLADRLGQIESRALRPIVLKQSTGFVIDPGVIVTTFDLARNKTHYEQIRVWSDAQVAYSTGEIVGQDPETNLVVIRLKGPGETLQPTIQISPEAEASIGDFVYAFWHAFGQPVSMRSGEVTGILRKVPLFECATFLETSLPTSPGTLGGPIVNLNGELVGMGSVFMIQGSMSEITYALPNNQLRFVVNQIRKTGVVQRGRLGVFVDEQLETEGDGREVVITRVDPDSAAARHGLQAGDIITAVNDEPVHCRMTLVSNLMKYRPMEAIDLLINREGREVHVSLGLDPVSPSPPLPGE